MLSENLTPEEKYVIAEYVRIIEGMAEIDPSTEKEVIQKIIFQAREIVENNQAFDEMVRITKEMKESDHSQE